MFISSALAQATETATAAPANDSPIFSFVPLVLIFAVFYFLIVRPQNKKMKAHQEMVSNVKIGNKIVTTGGIIGVVKDILVKENQVEIEIADGVRIKILKQHVADLIQDVKQDSKK